MKHLVSASLLAAALIHLLPVSGMLGPDWLEKLYGLSFDEPNLEILMRHRAVLFGLLGVFMAIAAFQPKLQGIAFVAGLVSVLAFLYLAWSVGGYNPQLGRVFTADIVALVGLLIGGAAYLYRRSKA